MKRQFPFGQEGSDLDILGKIWGNGMSGEKGTVEYLTPKVRSCHSDPEKHP